MSASLEAISRLLSRMFAAGLCLYPKAMRREYAAEMQAVFALKAQDAARRGLLALLWMAFREVIDLPLAAAAAHLRAPGGTMNQYFPDTSDQTPWSVALLSLLPFFIAGAGRIIVFYQSGFGRAQLDAGYFFPYLALIPVVALASLALGAVREFPRWSYPYAFSLVFALTDLYSSATYRFDWPTIGQDSFILILAVTLLALYLPPLRSFYRNIRQDWTLLSYSLFGIVLFLLAGVDRDEYPVLNLAVLLPSLIGMCVALAHLRIRQAPARIAVLVVGTFVGLFFRLLPIFTGMISIGIGIAIGMFMLLMFGTILAAILLSPLLVVMIRRQSAARK